MLRGTLVTLGWLASSLCLLNEEAAITVHINVALQAGCDRVAIGFLVLFTADRVDLGRLGSGLLVDGDRAAEGLLATGGDCCVAAEGHVLHGVGRLGRRHLRQEVRSHNHSSLPLVL